MGRSDLIAAYVGRLAAMARGTGIDADRLADEVADHIAQAAERNRLEGFDPSEAERLAIERFGTAEAVVASIATVAKGGPMSALIRMTARVVAMAATVALLVVHVVPSQSGPGNPFEGVAVVAADLLGAAALALVLGSHPSPFAWMSLARAPWLVLSLVAAPALGVLSGWGYGRIDLGFVVIHQGGRFYLGLVAALGLLVVRAASMARIRAAAGVGLVFAGALGLLLNGAWNGAWQPLGGIGAGQGNMGIILIVGGWMFLGWFWLNGRGGAPARARVAGWLVWAGERLAPPSMGIE